MSDKGWGWPSNSRKAHYFNGVYSLCRRWMFFGPLENGNNESPDNCLECRKRIAKTIDAEPRPEAGKE